MKFHDCKTAPSPRRVRIFLAEKGVEIESVQVDLGTGEQFSDAFRKLNPDCVVPVLELDDGTCLSEVIAICDFLERQYPEPPLFGRNDVEHATVLMWNTKIEQQGLLGMMDAFRNSAKGLAGRALTGPESYEQIPELAERGRKRVLQFFRRLDGQLEGREFVCGDFFSVADITALVVVDFAARGKIPVPEDAADLKRWYAAVSARPSAAA
ncbi:MAG TPA: glutathione S-transferase [Woeseiaceae bacterium]